MPRPDGMHARRRASSIEAACVGNSGQEDAAWGVVYLGINWEEDGGRDQVP